MMRLILLQLLILVSFYSQAQELLRGKIVDANLGSPVANAYIENVSKNTVYESDEHGDFAIKISKGDTLILSSIGYFWLKYIVVDFDYKLFEMTQQIYDLSKVVKNAPLNYDAFKYKILSMSPYEDSLKLGLQYEKYIPVRSFNPGEIGAVIDGPITGIYNAFSKHAKNYARAVELLDNKPLLLQANKKLTKEMVIDITKIPNQYFDEFISFCSFSDDYLALTSEYQIIMMLYLKYDEFVSIHPELQKL